jgi:hypothetical protein
VILAVSIFHIGLPHCASTGSSIDPGRGKWSRKRRLCFTTMQSMYAQLLSAGSDPRPTKGLLFRKGSVPDFKIRFVRLPL